MSFYRGMEICRVSHWITDESQPLAWTPFEPQRARGGSKLDGITIIYCISHRAVRWERTARSGLSVLRAPAAVVSRQPIEVRSRSISEASDDRGCSRRHIGAAREMGGRIVSRMTMDVGDDV